MRPNLVPFRRSALPCRARRRIAVVSLALACWTLAGTAAAPAGSARPESSLAAEILADQDLHAVLDKARALLAGGFNAGAGYEAVWIRDLNTFIELSLEVNSPAAVREALLTMFKLQGTSGDIPDGYVRKLVDLTSPPSVADDNQVERRSPLVPGVLAHKNTVETDQESSLIQAVRKYVATTDDWSILREEIEGRTVLERMGAALDWVFAERFDVAHGLIWGATTVDWGDVQPETDPGVAFDRRSHKAIDIYDNAMLAIAIQDYLRLLPRDADRAVTWSKRLADLRRNIRKHLWDRARRKFVPHIYLSGSPFPASFDEQAVYYHGGTTVAIEAGLLSQGEVEDALRVINQNVAQAGASSAGLTIYPAYPSGMFENPAMTPYSYQNGGDWCWFGGRLVQQLIRYRLVGEAYAALKPMVTRVKRHDGFYEFWSLDNQPRGSRDFRGSAGVLGLAIEQLMSWAEKNATR